MKLRANLHSFTYSTMCQMQQNTDKPDMKTLSSWSVQCGQEAAFYKGYY